MAEREGTHIRRPRVERLLDGALTRRVTQVVAPVGAGKSEVLRTWAADVGGVLVPLSPHERDLDLLAQRFVERLALHVPTLPGDLGGLVASNVGAQRDNEVRAATLAGMICGALAGEVRRDLAIVFDDVGLLADEPAAMEFVRQVILQAPPRVHLVLSGRQVPDFGLERLRERRQVLVIGGTELAMDRDEVWIMLGRVAGPGSVDKVDAVLAATNGWPVAVHTVAERLRAGGEVVPVEGPLVPQADEAVDLLEPEDLDLLRRISPLGSVGADLCTELGIEDAAARLAGLARAGLFLRPHPLRPEWYELTRLARAGIEPLPASEQDEVNRLAARWLFIHWQPDDGLECLLRARALDEAQELLEAVGDVMVMRGHVEVVLRALAELPDANWKERLIGIALHARGDWDAALEHLERAAGGADRIDPAIAWRIGLTHHQRGDLVTARAAYARSDPSLGESGDHAMAIAWDATVAWLQSDLEEAARLADEALELAWEHQDDRALAAVHTVLAMVVSVDGDWRANDAHYQRALEHAERAGDVMQRIRIQTNRSSLHLERGEYEAALACVDAATRLDDLGGFATFGALALVNRAEVHVATGRLEEAQADLEAAIERYREVNSDMVGYALTQLGNLQLLRGDRPGAIDSFEQALARHRDDVQGTLPAVCGLAMAKLADDPDEAAEHAAHALDIGDTMGASLAQATACEVAAARGMIETARLHAWHCLLVTEERSDRVGRAWALVLSSRLAPTPKAGLEEAAEAARLYDVLGNPIGRARADLAAASHSDPATAREIAKGVIEAMRAIGCRLVEEEAEHLLATLDPVSTPVLAVQVLGRFRVLRGGRPVAAGQWQSRKARTLLKLLVARQGRIVPRDELSERLWPDDDPAKTANRLNVALSTLRSVLDPDREHPSGHHVVTDDAGVGLDLDHVEVDALALLADVTAGQDQLRQGNRPGALELFGLAARRFTGDAFAEDPYDDWTQDLREEVRVAHLLARRELAEGALASGNVEDAVRHLLRLLEQEPHDEPAHLQLVRLFGQVGRHGEARRRYRLYVARMRELGVEPSPFPSPDRELGGVLGPL